MTAAGSARTILTSHGMARMRVPAAELALAAFAVIPLPPTSRRASRKGSIRMATDGGWSRRLADPIPLAGSAPEQTECRQQYRQDAPANHRNREKPTFHRCRVGEF